MAVAGYRITLSVVKADVGGLVGHVSSHPDVLDSAKERLANSREKGYITDFNVLRCGDDLHLIVTHREGVGSPRLHRIIWDILYACAEIAKKLKLYGASEDILTEEFTGDLRTSGPSVAELEFIERDSEPVIIFMANKALAGSWNLPLYRIFADPFNTIGLIIDPSMFEGFSFTLIDIRGGREITLAAPSETHSLLTLAGSTSRYAVKEVRRTSDGLIAAVTSAETTGPVRRSPAGRADPIAIIRSQNGLPSAGEVLEAFAHPLLVRGWMRGSHTGPLMPVPFYEANPSRFDGPPRIISAGFQVTNGRLIGPHDMFDDPSFDEARRTANKVAEYMRRHGPFQPHRLPEEELLYTTVPIILDRLKDRFRKCS